MKAVIIGIRLIKEISSDKRTVAMVFLAPILIVSLLYLVLNSEIKQVNLGVNESFPLDLQTDALNMINLQDNEMEQAMTDGTIDGYLLEEGDGYTLHIPGTDPSVDSKLAVEIQKSMADVIKENLTKLPIKINYPELSVERKYGEEEGTMFDSIAPFMMGYIVFFLIFLLSGIAFLRERISGTMSRMMATSVHRGHVVAGYMMGFGFFAFWQTVIVQIYMIEVLGIPNRGNFFLILLTNLCIAGGSMTLGILLSAFARNEFQLFQFIPIVIIPQTLFAGLFSLRDAHPVIIGLSKCFPLKYAADALRAVMLEGKGFSAIWGDLAVLIGFMILFLVMNIRVLRKYRNS